MDIKELEKVIQILRENGVTEFELEQDGTHIKLARGQLVAAAPVATALPTAVEVAHHAAPQLSVSAPAADAYAGLERVESPIVGTFYRRPSPDADAFVQEGDVVKKGDTLCIVEAMKLMNEIEAPISGKIAKIFLKDPQIILLDEPTSSLDSFAEEAVTEAMNNLFI